MGVKTPWCPRCGAWRGYVATLCKGCARIQADVGQIEDPVQRKELLQREVQARFVKISEMRTDREAFTQALEEMVEQNVERLKTVAYDWMRMRVESRRVRFANMYAIELVTVARAALEEVGSLSLELTKYTQNQAAHEERMQRVTAGMQAVEKFVSPDANEPEEPKDESNDDLPPGVEE